MLISATFRQSQTVSSVSRVFVQWHQSSDLTLGKKVNKKVS